MGCFSKGKVSLLFLSLCATAFGNTIIDEAGNIYGDPKRSFVDIVKVETQEIGSFFSIKTTVAGRFPDPHLLLGLGMQIVYTLKNKGDEELKETPKITTSLTENGWDLQTEVILDSDTIPWETIANSNDFTVLLPTTLLAGFNQIEITASTANKPKWKPLTGNPPILIDLQDEEENQLETLPK